MEEPRLLAPGLTVTRWQPHMAALGGQARTFCLSTIKDTYGYDYRPDWHADLDSLTQGESSRYNPASGGVFLVVQNLNGDIVGTGGAYSLTHKPHFIALFGGKYANPAQVACMGRTYLQKQYRGNALSRTLVPMLEAAAAGYGYTHMCLDCEASAARLRNHWESFGFTTVIEDGSTAFYDKSVHNSPAA